MRKGRVAAALCAAIVIFAPLAPAAAGPESANPFAARLLAAHNRERERLGIPRLKWSQHLAAQAAQWAASLARRNTMEHAAYEVRQGAGENLWMGAAGYYSAEDMVGGFVSERQYFRPGSFPNNSTTGDWKDVGHYTQLIWPGTQEVGCAVTKGEANDFLVCRYWPAGNTVGVRVP